MADDAVEPLREIQPGDGASSHGGGIAMPPRRDKGVSGRVVAVHRRTAQHDQGEHRFDVSIGVEHHSELVIRVESGSCAHLEGKRVIVLPEE